MHLNRLSRLLQVFREDGGRGPRSIGVQRDALRVSRSHATACAASSSLFQFCGWGDPRHGKDRAGRDVHQAPGYAADD